MPGAVSSFNKVFFAARYAPDGSTRWFLQGLRPVFDFFSATLAGAVHLPDAAAGRRDPRPRGAGRDQSLRRRHAGATAGGGDTAST